MFVALTGSIGSSYVTGKAFAGESRCVCRVKLSGAGAAAGADFSWVQVPVSVLPSFDSVPVQRPLTDGISNES